ncbi:MAG: Xaa-Pro peptidase family protein [Ilumatobacteraceae bacterium]|nr:Xaa-Pro peptidase family protein [Ilumatobacteraceae bacterium]
MRSLDGLAPISAAGRAERVARRCDGATLYVADLTDVRWLTGFTGSAGWVVVGPDRLVLGTDGRYADRAAAELGAAGVAAEIVVERSRPALRERLVELLRSAERVVADPHHLTHADWLDLAAEVELAPMRGAVEAERRVKDAGEIDRIALAAAIATDALAAVAPVLGDGVTEADVRDELDHRMRRLGADGPSYDTIVAAGPEHAARPHHLPTRRTIVEGDLVVIDVGALVDGYHSDMTRTFVVGDPTTEQREWFELVGQAQGAGLAAVRAGVPAGDVDRACRDVFERAGVAELFVHGTGHGVGLQIHEDPFQVAGSPVPLVAGDVVTVEPGLYRAGVGGCRIEDLVVVTETGHRNLTSAPKDTPCLPSPPTT